MKKIILHSLFFAGGLLLITSCSKQVKAPANKPNVSSATSKTITTPSTTTTTTTQTQPQSGHTCPGSGSSNGYSGTH